MIGQRDMIPYVRKRLLGCWRARHLLTRKGYHVDVIDMSDGTSSRPTIKRLARSAYRETVPYVFVDQRPVGGLDEIMALDHSGVLARLVRGEV